jgi:hypothetical protein
MHVHVTNWHTLGGDDRTIFLVRTQEEGKGSYNVTAGHRLATDARLESGGSSRTTVILI